MPIELTKLPVLVMTVASVVLPFMYAVPAGRSYLVFFGIATSSPSACCANGS